MLTLRFQIMIACILAICGSAHAQISVELQCKQLNESSGVSVSSRDPQIVWSHNDSGSGPRLYAFTRAGKWIAEVELKNAKAVDWEDMCSFQRDGKHYLAIGDVGDNLNTRSTVVVYVIEEPKLDLQVTKPVRERVGIVQKIEVQYEGGSVDCESLAYDPQANEFLLATKENFRCRLATFDASPAIGETPIQLRFKQVLLLPLTTGADISTDGQWLVIATYGPACLLKRTQDGRWDSGEKAVQTITLPDRRQGESICFGDQNTSLLLTSEFAPSPLWTVPIKP